MQETELWSGGPTYIQAQHMKLTSDAILLADFANIKPGEKGADLGCASGILMLLLLNREKQLSMTGIELLPDACALAEENMRRNGFSERAEIRCSDYFAVSKFLPNGGYDFILSNPPYYAAGQGAAPSDRNRAVAREADEGGLRGLCHTASRLCRSGGRIYFSYRPERLAELLEQMHQAHLEPKRLRFAHHQASANAFLVLVEGRKDGRPGLTVEAPFFLHDATGEEAEAYKRICHLK